MRHILILIFFLGMGMFCIYTANEFHEFLATDDSPILVDRYRMPRTVPQEPLRLHIPKLNINTSISAVGLDSQGLMEVPKTAQEVAWYKPGPKPGEQGSAVLAGHYDWTDGPAVFYRLEELEKGDAIVVTDDHNQSWQFIVTEKASYPAQEFPVEKVFKTSTLPTLNLVTCDGPFDQNQKAYPNRIVISATITDLHSKTTDKTSPTEQ
jgi:sortase A